MKRNQIATLERALQIAAEDAYQEEVVDTEMEELVIGNDGEYFSKQEWIDERIEDWLERTGY